jgi:LysM repeat protein
MGIVELKLNEMKRIIIFILLFFINLTSGQTASNFDISKHKVVLHKVTLGETMLIISKKYLVNPTEIYKVNKFSVDGLERSLILKIPNTSIMPDDKNRVNLNAFSDSNKSKQGLLEFTYPYYFQPIEALKHFVISGETVYQIAQKYNFSVSQLLKLNKEQLKNGIKESLLLTVELSTENSNNQLNGFTKNENLKEQNKSKLVQEHSEYSNLISNSKQASSSLNSKAIYTKFEKFADNSNKVISSNIVNHEVKNGETLKSVCDKYHIQLSNLINENKEALRNSFK